MKLVNIVSNFVLGLVLVSINYIYGTLLLLGYFLAINDPNDSTIKMSGKGAINMIHLFFPLIFIVIFKEQIRMRGRLLIIFKGASLIYILKIAWLSLLAIVSEVPPAGSEGPLGAIVGYIGGSIVFEIVLFIFAVFILPSKLIKNYREKNIQTS